MTFIYSFCNYSITKSPVFTGLNNYVYMFTKDMYFWPSLINTLKYVLMTVPLKLAFALFVAMILNIDIKGVNIFRTVYYLPSIFGGSVALSVIWKFLFMDNGIMNKFLSYFHIHGPSWLGNPHISLFTISLLSVWEFGSSMVIFLAALKQVPNELYEASMLDGASKIKRFFL